MTEFWKLFDASLFPSGEHKIFYHSMPGYEALTFALLDPESDDDLFSHFDSMNDWRDGYKQVATYS